MMLDLAVMAVLTRPPELQLPDQAKLAIERKLDIERKAIKRKDEIKRESKRKGDLDQEAEKIAEKIEETNNRIKELERIERERVEAERIAELNRIATATAATPVYSNAPSTTQTYSTPQPVRASGGGNSYAPGYCTWYVKEMRPDIGSFWGNANQWVSSATASGYATGSQPRVGAIGVSYAGAYGHVVYVTGVSADGSTITLSEMNYSGLGVIGTRTDSASNYIYIY